jgi:antitoxin (DNA-binding transcriptional repressor) of toxin-antitoxin stability system
MKASIVSLRRRMAEVLRALDRNEPVAILYRGRKWAILVPAGRGEQEIKSATEHPAFGMWKDRKDLEDVRAHLRELRKGRFQAV